MTPITDAGPSPSRRAVAAGFAAAGLMLVAGCADPLTKPFPERRFFTLEVRRPATAPVRPDGPVLVVRRFRASPGYDDPSLLTRIEPATLRRDFYNQFLVPPQTLIEGRVRQWLEGAGLFRQVVRVGSQIAPSHALEGNLIALYGDFSGDRPLARVAVQLSVLAIEGDAGRPALAADRSFEVAEPLAAATPDALVAGYDRALAAILTQFEATLKAAL